jgi:hypothetical protein
VNGSIGVYLRFADLIIGAGAAMGTGSCDAEDLGMELCTRRSDPGTERTASAPIRGIDVLTVG